MAGGGSSVPKNLGAILLIEGRLTGAAAAAFAAAPVISPLNDAALMDAMLTEIAAACKLTVLSSSCESLEPYGLTMIKVLSESHVSIHTWPDIGAFSLDVYSCKDALNEWDILDVIRGNLRKAGVGGGEACLDEGVTLRCRAITRGLPPQTPVRPRMV